MSSSLHNDDRRFDRLVDGELSESERKQLLRSLDQEPDGWRRCALAFLEAQTWREGFGALFRPNRPAAAPVPRSVAAENWSVRKIGGLVLAVAASFLLAFGLADYWHGGNGTVPPRGDHTNLAGNQPVTPHSPVAPHVVGASPQLVSLPTAGDGNGAMVIPATQRDRWDEGWLKTVPSAMPPNVRQAFERTGHHVQRRQNLVSIPLDDGRVLVVPVEQMEIQPAEQPVY
jgi:hypothetical protein